MYPSLEKSIAEVGRSRKKREGLSKHGVLRLECPYTSLAFGIGENPMWGNPGLRQLHFSAWAEITLGLDWMRP